MKNHLKATLSAALIIGLLTLTGCQSNKAPVSTSEAPAKAEVQVLKVGASPLPHAELLNLVKEELKAEGIDLQIIEFTDYVKPNLSLNDGEIDANFFQPVPYQESFNKDHGTDIVSVGTIHVEPLGLYSKKIKSIEALPEGAQIAIPSDAVNGGRALILLASKGLITLADGAGLEATEKDIAVNSKKFKFIAVEAAQLPRVLEDVDASIINGNYALEAGLTPTKDAILLEGADSPYANIISVKKGNEADERVIKLVKALQSEKVKAYIESHYNGGVVPAF
jgi:D-methionine transport system substrate-binding protein